MWKQRESSSRQLPIRFYTVLLDPASFVLPGVWDACLGYRWGYRGGYTAWLRPFAASLLACLYNPLSGYLWQMPNIIQEKVPNEINILSCASTWQLIFILSK